MRSKNLLLLLFSFLAYSSFAQRINVDSLRTIAGDESLTLEERHKAGKILLELHRKNLQSLDPASKLKEIPFGPFIVRHREHTNDLDSLTEELIKLTLDRELKVALRKNAIDLLVAIDSPKAQEFLLRQFTKINFAFSDGGADAEIQSYHAFYSLIRQSKDNWSLIPVIFASLEEQKSEKEIFFIYALLQQILSDANLIPAIAESYLKAATAVQRNNISQILQQHQTYNGRF